MDFAAGFLGCRRVTYVYHRLWPVYEDYLAGRFDASSKPHLGFRLMEAPHEYFESVVFADALDRVHETKRLFAGFIEYRYALYREGAGYAGYFYELIREICHRSGWELVLTGKTGYSAAIAGLDAGKFDIYASPVWPTEERLRQALFSASVSRSEAYVYARPGIDASRLATDASLRMAVLDTDITDQLSRSDFPLAIKRRFSGLSRIEDLLYAVGRAEADFTVCEEMTYRSYRQE